MNESDRTTLQIPSTHVVAVTGYVYQQGKFLLLKRAQPPLIWAPPGGRLGEHEDPKTGVIREVREETGLDIQVLGLVDYWFGQLGSYGRLLSLDFLTLSAAQDVILSGEHLDYTWARLEDLERGHPPLGNEPCSFKLTDFQKAASECRKYMYQMPPPMGG
jgi:8-oxo-dGTP diphosphatase